ncbi:MAG: transposase [Verrucomicrobiaceae bacterium]|nr:MAG: transposase [Verrucomicrobiaceae bacterium]
MKSLVISQVPKLWKTWAVAPLTGRVPASATVASTASRTRKSRKDTGADAPDVLPENGPMHAEQVVYALKQVESGAETVAAICRKMGVSQATFYAWKKKKKKKKKHAGMGITEVRELRHLREENAKLKRLVADLSMDKHILLEVIAKKLCNLCAGASWPGG